MRLRVITFALFILLAASCQDSRQTVTGGATSPSPTEPSPSPQSGATSPCMPTSGGTEGAFVFLKDVQLKETADYDLITFEFAPAERGVYAVPKFQIQTAKRPLKKDPSDQPMEVTGQYLADIIFHGASGVDIGADGYREVYTGPKEIKTKLPILVEAEQQSDFEATLSWIMGLNEDRCWSPVELSDPARLEIRFIH